MTQILSPTFMRCSPADAHGSISIHASGAPSDPCFGASVLFLRVERITPIGRRLKRPLRFGFILPSYEEKGRDGKKIPIVRLGQRMARTETKSPQRGERNHPWHAVQEGRSDRAEPQTCYAFS